MEVRRPRKTVNRPLGPIMVVEGIEEVIKKDLGTHKIILERTNIEILSFRTAVSTEVKKKKHYLSLIGGGKFNDDALRTSIDQMNVNITHLSNKVKLSQDKIKHETLIVDTLTEQLDNQYKDLEILSEYRKNEK